MTNTKYAEAARTEQAGWAVYDSPDEVYNSLDNEELHFLCTQGRMTSDYLEH